MIEEVREDILTILEETLEACKVEDYVALKDISNHTIHNASIFQDKDSVSIAVIIFSLYKIAARSSGREKQICGRIITLISDAYKLLKRERIDEYKEAIKKTFRTISGIDRKFRLYIEEVVNQAEIKKGSKLYEHGISIARAADILGISQWELMNYIGKTRLPEVEKEGVDIRSRIEFVKDLFGV